MNCSGSDAVSKDKGMGSGSSKAEPPVVVTSKIPLFCLKKLGPRHVLVAGGGGESKTGVLNLIQTYLLTFENRKLPKCSTPMKAILVDTIDTDIYATMNMDVVCCSNPEKGRYLIAAGHGQYCDVYETTGYGVGKDDADEAVLKFNIKMVGRLTTSEQVESFQKCVRFDRSTAGRRVVTGGEDGRIRVWNTQALVEDRNPEVIHKPLVDIEAHKSDVFDIDIASDGRIIISVGHDGIAKMWDMGLGTLIRAPCGLTVEKNKHFEQLLCEAQAEGMVSSLCVSSCGNFTGVGSMGGSVYIFDTHEMKELIAFKETHGIFVTAVEFLDRTASDIKSLVQQPASGPPRNVPGPGAVVARASLISLSADQTIQVIS
ncbi:WD domain, G-beta repeat protein, partial [Ostertagia ostertagi]